MNNLEQQVLQRILTLAIPNPALPTKERRRLSAKLYHLRHPEVVARHAWKSMLKREHGVSEEWYNAKLSEQGYRCAICGTESTGKRRHFDVDHDHTTGLNRGLLCSPCNAGIGHFKEDTEKLQKAINYLVKHKSN